MNNKIRRIKRVRAKIFGTANRPRLSVSKSSKHIYAQLIDDEKGETMAFARDADVKISDEKSKIQSPKSKINSKSQIPNSKKEKTEKERKEFISKKMIIAYEMGKLIAKKALEKGIKKSVFDRRGYKYHGIIKAVAEGAREGGLQF